MYVCVSTHTRMYACVYGIVRHTLYFLFPLNSVSWGSFHVSAYRVTSFLIEERYRSINESYSCPPSLGFRFQRQSLSLES